MEPPFSLESISEGDEKMVTEADPIFKKSDLSSPVRSNNFSIDITDSSKYLEAFARPISLFTQSSESCYSVASATSLSLMISSDIFKASVKAPSFNTKACAEVVDENMPETKTVKTVKTVSTLAERRGFKGARLFTSRVNINTFPQLSPSTFSPRTPTSPVTPGFVKTVSNFWALSPKIKTPTDISAFPEHIQDDYNGANPFDMSADSYFAPILEDTSAHCPNVYDLSAYSVTADHKKASLEAKTHKSRHIGSSCIPTQSVNSIETSIYNASIDDVCSQLSAEGKSKPRPSAGWFPETAFQKSPYICLTPPSAPSSPKRSSTKPGKTASEAQVDTVSPTPTIVSREACSRRPIGDPALPYTQVASSSSNALRPLILPLRIAKRKASATSTPLTTSPKSTPELNYFTATSTPSRSPSPERAVDLPTFLESLITDSLSGSESQATKNTLVSRSYLRESRSTSSSIGKRRSKAVVDILSLLDSVASGAVDTLEAINDEDDSINVSQSSIFGLVEAACAV